MFAVCQTLRVIVICDVSPLNRRSVGTCAALTAASYIVDFSDVIHNCKMHTRIPTTNVLYLYVQYTLQSRTVIPVIQAQL